MKRIELSDDIFNAAAARDRRAREVFEKLFEFCEAAFAKYPEYKETEYGINDQNITDSEGYYYLILCADPKREHGFSAQAEIAIHASGHVVIHPDVTEGENKIETDSYTFDLDACKSTDDAVAKIIYAVRDMEGNTFGRYFAMVFKEEATASWFRKRNVPPIQLTLAKSGTAPG